MVCKLSGVRACALTRCAHRTFGFTTRWFKLQVSRLHCYLYQSKLFVLQWLSVAILTPGGAYRTP